MHRKSAYILFLAVLGMLVIGIVMLFSTSAFARDSHGDVYFFIRRQAIWLGIGLAVCTVAALIDYHFWQRTWWLWFGLAFIALALCFVPHLGMRINGSRRWVGRGSRSGTLQTRCRLAADAGVDRLGQRRNRRTRPRQRPAKNALSALRPHGFHFPDYR